MQYAELKGLAFRAVDRKLSQGTVSARRFRHGAGRRQVPGEGL
jgi:hypothetical protein